MTDRFEYKQSEHDSHKYSISIVPGDFGFACLHDFILLCQGSMEASKAKSGHGITSVDAILGLAMNMGIIKSATVEYIDAYPEEEG